MAGGGKTILAMGMLLSLIPDLSGAERLLWLTRTRKARDEALALFRELLDNPFIAIGLGRGQQDSAQEHDEEWDPVVKAALERREGPPLQRS